MRFLIGASLIFILTSCATDTSSYYKSTVNTWRGSNGNTLIKRWGIPDTKIINPDGHTVYIYRTYNSTDYPGSYSPQIGVNTSRAGRPVIVSTPNTASAGSRKHLSHTCLAIFETNAQGAIINTQTRGTHCTGGIPAN